MSEKTETIRMDKVIADTGVADSIEGPPGMSQELVGKLMDPALDFLIAGGTFGWDEWTRLSPESRRAFAEAGARLRAVQASNIAAGIHDRAIATALSTGEPVQDVRNRVALEEAVDAVVGESEDENPG